jgi:hypothetical protein
LVIQYNNIERGSSETGIVVVYRNHFQADFFGMNNIYADPLFVDPDASNYHLLSDSPMIDQGLAEAAPDDDIDRDSRPMGAGIDIGADEYVTSGLGGTIVGATGEFVICKNLATGQRIGIRLHGGATTWDCEAGGLVVNTGDRFTQVIFGRAD